jgi:hypothetical protein
MRGAAGDAAGETGTAGTAEAALRDIVDIRARYDDFILGLHGLPVQYIFEPLVIL